MRSSHGRRGPRVAWWEKCQEEGEGSKEKAHHFFFMGKGEQVVLFSHIRCSVNTTERRKKKEKERMSKCLLVVEGCSLVPWENRHWSFRGLSVLAQAESPLGSPM